jgi:hypothetical protein
LPAPNPESRGPTVVNLSQPDATWHMTRPGMNRWRTVLY